MTAIADFSHRPTWWERALERLQAFFPAGGTRGESRPVDARELGIDPRAYLTIGHG